MADNFHVRGIWDDEAGVFYSESDVTGLHIEAPTWEAFVDLANAIVPELLEANHGPTGPHAGPVVRNIVVASALARAV